MQKTLHVYDIDEFRYLGKATDLYVNTLSEHLRQHEFIFKPHKHSFFFICLCTKGTGKHLIDFVEYEIKPGSMFLICPGKAHTWTLSDDAEGYVLFHTRNFVNMHSGDNSILDYPFYFSIYNSPFIYLKVKESIKIESLFADILQEYRGANLMRFQRVSALLDLLYIDLIRLYVPESAGSRENQAFLSTLRKFELLLDKHHRKVKSPSEYARMLHLSEKHLNKICKETLNKTASHMIFDRVLIEAKRMLVHTQSTVSQIADYLGYNDIQYFSRLFKKHSGISPGEFRKQINTLSGAYPHKL